MPNYDYKCEKCGAVYEISHAFDERPRKTCLADSCDGRLRRVFSPPTIIFKGSGWHVTDYGRGNGRNDKSKSPTESAEKAKEAIESNE